MNKAVILFAYGTALYLILRKAYQEGHTGIPEPSLLAPPTYLYGILALAESFVGGIATFMAISLTFGLMWGYQDLQNGTTTVGKIVGGALAPKVKAPQKRTADTRNKNATQQIPKVSPTGKR
jgi:hypothetical protein